MFLALTALEDFWDKTTKILFLGEWCKIYSRKASTDRLSHKVLPYHWDDRAKLYRDYLYIDRLYEKILPLLGNSLNSLHGVDHSTRYWRIILGFWLNWFIGMLFDRYESIKIAELTGEITNTYILNDSSGTWTPNDFNRFAVLSERDDYYNLFLFSRIIRHRKGFPYDMKQDPAVQADSRELTGNFQGNWSAGNLVRANIKKILAVWDKTIAKHFAGYVLSLAEFDIMLKIRLELSLRQLPFFGYFGDSVPAFHYNPELRSAILDEFQPANEFERFLAGMIGEQIPKSYIEGYSTLDEKAAHLFPARPKVIYSDNTLYSNEYFKFWAAANVDCGAAFAVVQHGGLYGTAKWFAAEQHEIEVSDIFFSWGWRDQSPKVKPLPSIKLHRTRKLKAKPDGKILLVTSLSGRYSYHLYSEPIAASGYNAHLEEHYAFIAALSTESKTALLVRLYPIDRGKWFQRERLHDRFPEVRVYLGPHTMHDQLAESRLFVGTYNATTYLETFTADFPTVLFWNPDKWELRAAAQPYFDELRRAGILFDTPEAAADHVNRIFPDPLAWWHKDGVQKAKKYFCDRFALTSNDLLKPWRNELKGLLKLRN